MHRLQTPPTVKTNAAVDRADTLEKCTKRRWCLSVDTGHPPTPQFRCFSPSFVPSFVHYRSALRGLSIRDTCSSGPSSPSGLPSRCSDAPCAAGAANPAGVSPSAARCPFIYTAELVLMLLTEWYASSDGHQPPTPLGRSTQGACVQGGLWVVVFLTRGGVMLPSGTLGKKPLPMELFEN